MTETYINVEVIKNYFAISYGAAAYIYVRRRSGEPWIKPNEPEYLEWSLGLLNALIKLDKSKQYDWNNMHFGDEERILKMHDISLDNKVTPLKKNSVASSNGWTKISYKKTRTPSVIKDLMYTSVSLDENAEKYK